MNLGGGGALAEEPLMPKLEFREKECLENFGIFAKVLEWMFCENGGLFIGLGRSTLEKKWPAIKWVFGWILGLISQFIMINWLIKHKGNKWVVIKLIGWLIGVIKREKMIEKVESKVDSFLEGTAGLDFGFWVRWVFIWWLISN